MAPPRSQPNPLEVLWQGPAIVAVVLAGEAVAVLLALAPGFDGDRITYFGLASLLIQWITMLTLGGLYLLRDSLSRLTGPRVAWMALGLLMLSTWLTGAATWLLLGELMPMAGRGWLDFLLRLSLMALTIGLLGLAAYQNHLRARRLAVLAKQAELEALQARIRPHFLFNTLNTGAALVHARPGEAERLLLDLADLFRAALSGPREIPLADELALARRYLEIESLRFGDRLRLSWDLPDQLPPVQVPTLSIQPLVENAIRHGVEPSADGNDVLVRVELDRASVRVIVSNGLPRSGGQPASGHQVGLISARERIIALSQGRGRLDTEIVDGRYVATIHLPLDAA
ncbi:sensor histidine kinase [Arenimonas sp. MALMAid1274]|uniref:sensor histidine kinase n=1 Tax=Arenimonas sp. MALMAid1274 TaxID=3411630 RepID=UPI003BA0F3DC